jgi:hypothetical protein
MVKFCFWNLKNRPLAQHVRRIVESQGIDLLVLAESPYRPGELLNELSEGVSPLMHFCDGKCDLVQVFSKFPSVDVQPLQEAARYTIRSVTLPKTSIVLIGVHLKSKLQAGGETQLLDCQELATDIRRIESEVGHERTVLVGDLNMNPFDPGVSACRALNAVMFRDRAMAGSRTYQGQDYPHFYNPMWSRMGDLSAGPPGTYFYRDSNDVCHYWHMLDQILVRSALVPSFLVEELRILESDGIDDLLAKRGDLTVPSVSDHLPLVFALDL